MVLIIVIFDEFDEQLWLATAATEEFFFDSRFHLIRYTYKHRYSQSAVIYIYIHIYGIRPGTDIYGKRLYQPLAIIGWWHAQGAVVSVRTGATSITLKPQMG